MGRTLRTIVEIELPEREAHASRMLVDLCENIHIHHREWRQVFTLPEWIEFVRVLVHAERDVRAYLAQNPDYREGEFGTTLMEASNGLKRLLRNSPAANQSTYFDRRFCIEILHPSMRDEMHVHWRDHRFAIPRTQFRQIAEAFGVALEELDKWEAEGGYPPSKWRTRTMEQEEESKAKYRDIPQYMGGEVDVPVSSIGPRDSAPRDPEWVAGLVEKYEAGEWVAPVLISTERDGSSKIIDGNHRLTAAIRAGRGTINAVRVPITFDESKLIRQAEATLKKFDREVSDEFGMSAFFREWLAWKLGTHWEGHFEEAKKAGRRVRR